MPSSDDGVTLYLPNSVMRERARVPSTTVSNLERVKGYLRPKYVDVLEDGRRVGGIGEGDLQRIRDGYACGECLAYFDERSRNCPSCGEVLDPNSSIVDFLPQYWLPDPNAA